mgnify:CR=1 FL=1
MSVCEQFCSRSIIKEQIPIRMSLQQGCRNVGVYRLRKRAVNRIRLHRMRSNGNHMGARQYLLRKHGYGLLGDILKTLEPPFPDLLHAAFPIQSDDSIRFGRIEISRRIIKGNMSVLPYPDYTDINRVRPQCFRQFRDIGSDISFPIDKICSLEVHF